MPNRGDPPSELGGVSISRRKRLGPCGGPTVTTGTEALRKSKRSYVHCGKVVGQLEISRRGKIDWGRDKMHIEKYFRVVSDLRVATSRNAKTCQKC